MKKLVKLTLSIGLLGGSLFFTQQTKACKVGEVYKEGNRVVFCWGQNGNDCAKCVKAELEHE